MRVVFIGKSHAFSLHPLDRLAAGHEVVGIVESGARHERRGGWLRRRASQLGGAATGRDDLRGRSRRLGAPYLYLTRRNRDELATLLVRVRADILCIASLNQLLPKEILDLPRHGAINLHPSMLPRYHGPYPWFWQYHDFQLEIGVTVHALDEGQDTGPLLRQEPMTLPLGTDIVDAMEMAGAVGARLMAAAVDELASGAARPMSQPPHNWPKARIVRPDERFVDWDRWPLERVWHFMRGTYPWVDATTYPPPLDPRRVRAAAVERVDTAESPGTVSRDDLGYYIAHSEGVIRLTTDM